MKLNKLNIKTHTQWNDYGSGEIYHEIYCDLYIDGVKKQSTDNVTVPNLHSIFSTIHDDEYNTDWRELRLFTCVCGVPDCVREKTYLHSKQEDGLLYWRIDFSDGKPMEHYIFEVSQVIRELIAVYHELEAFAEIERKQDKDYEVHSTFDLSRIVYSRIS
jgi:hypothetical protein